VSRFRLGVLLAAATGAAIAYVDSRLSWDDTGVAAVAVLAASATFTLWIPRRRWLWAILVAWVPLVGILHAGNAASLLALAFAAAGGATGAAVSPARRPVTRS
jgi:hypothetical protein